MTALCGGRWFEFHQELMLVPSQRDLDFVSPC
jgi:hypothetical protein